MKYQTPYHFILYRKPAVSGGTISALRKLLIEQNQSEFQNPRDPTSINLTKAFTKFDTDRLVNLHVKYLCFSKTYVYIAQ